jgi:hypothetical protein
LKLPATKLVIETGGTLDANRQLHTPDDRRVGDYVSVSQDGRHSVSLPANGTPLNGVEPVVRLVADDRVLGLAEVVGDRLGMQSWTVSLVAGTHETSTRFVNSAYSNSEDRNLFVGQSSAGPENGSAAPWVTNRTVWLAGRASRG